MGDAEFIRNLAQVSFRAALVLHHRCPADDLQVCDFCQIIEDFVLHTISEKRVFGIGTQIFKWKYPQLRAALGGVILSPKTSRLPPL